MKVNDYKKYTRKNTRAYHQHCWIRSNTNIPPDRNIPIQPPTEQPTLPLSQGDFEYDSTSIYIHLAKETNFISDK